MLKYLKNVKDHQILQPCQKIASFPSEKRSLILYFFEVHLFTDTTITVFSICIWKYFPRSKFRPSLQDELYLHYLDTVCTWSNSGEHSFSYVLNEWFRGGSGIFLIIETSSFNARKVSAFGVSFLFFIFSYSDWLWTFSL